MAKHNFYAVRKGREVGITKTWAECQKRVTGFKGAEFKSFPTLELAEEFLNAASHQHATGAVVPAPASLGHHPVLPPSSACHSDPIPSTTSLLDYNRKTLYKSNKHSRRSRIKLKRPAPKVQKRSSAVKLPGLWQSAQKTDVGEWLPCARHEPQPAKQGRIIIYTDGSCLENGKKFARAGYGAFYDVGDHRNLSGRLPGEKQTNQRAELYAMVKALENHLGSDEVLEIRSDSKYCIKACKYWMPAFVKAREDERKSYQNLDLMLRLHFLIQQRSATVHLVHVPAHSNIPGNEAADALARSGADLAPIKSEKFYAVRKGREVGITRTWAECQQRVTGFQGAEFKSFPTLELAEEFLNAANNKDAISSCSDLKRPAPKPTSSTNPSKVQKLSSAVKLPGLWKDSVQSSQTTDGRIIIYTVGSCLGNGQNGARAGYGAFYDVGDPRNLSGRVPGEKQTHQRGELFAMMKVLEYNFGNDEVLEIRSDSEYCIKACQEWMPAYLREREGKRRSYENLDLILKVHSLIQQRSAKVHLVHVPAHSNIPGNEAADVLAKAGALLGSS